MEAKARRGTDCFRFDGGMYCGMARGRAPVVDLAGARARRRANRHRLGDLTAYLPLVKRVARLAKFSPYCGMTYEDAVQEGFIGLMDAAERWSDDTDASFRTYASYRILGQIIDASRDSSWKTRRDDKEQVIIWDKTDIVPDESSGTSELADTARCLRRILAGEWKDAREQTMWHCLYEKGWTLLATAKLLGVSESRVSQLRSVMLKRLRARV